MLVYWRAIPQTISFYNLEPSYLEMPRRGCIAETWLRRGCTPALPRCGCTTALPRRGCTDVLLQRWDMAALLYPTFVLSDLGHDNFTKLLYFLWLLLSYAHIFNYFFFRRGNIIIIIILVKTTFFFRWTNPSLGGTIRNHLKEWLRKQKWQNHFSRPFPLNVFTTVNYNFFMFYLCLISNCIPIPIQLHHDNESCIKLAQNSKFHKRSRHITINTHFLHKQVEKNTIQLVYCSTKNMIANFLTKAIPWPKDDFCVFHSGLHYVDDII